MALPTDLKIVPLWREEIGAQEKAFLRYVLDKMITTHTLQPGEFAMLDYWKSYKILAKLLDTLEFKNQGGTDSRYPFISLKLIPPPPKDPWVVLQSAVERTFSLKEDTETPLEESSSVEPDPTSTD